MAVGPNNPYGCEYSSSNKARFKGLESFLKRAAFNLEFLDTFRPHTVAFIRRWVKRSRQRLSPHCRPPKRVEELSTIVSVVRNTPSRTEVKIISCIPIDVTDLQQKIIQLEQQVKEVSKNNKSKSATKTSSSRVGVGANNPMVGSSGMGSAMEDSGTGQSGIGQSGTRQFGIGQCKIGPSGTGQSGIGQSERGQSRMGQSGMGHYGMGHSGVGQYGKGPTGKGQSGMESLDGYQGPVLPLIYPSPESSSTCKPCKCEKSAKSGKFFKSGKKQQQQPQYLLKPDDTTYSCLPASVISTAIKDGEDPSRLISDHNAVCGGVSYDQCSLSGKVMSKVRSTLEKDIMNYINTETKNNRKMVKEYTKRFFWKKKEVKRPRPAIYFAHTEFQNPFNTHSLQTGHKKKKQKPEDPYLDQVVYKQYIASLAGNHASSTSGFSTPVCRDAAAAAKAPHTNESDLCSCCRGPFHNIDRHLTAAPHLPQNKVCQEAYYDSRVYDVVPVREKPFKVKEDHIKKKEHKMNVNHWATSLQVQPKVPPVTVNYHTATHYKNNRKKSYQVKKNTREIVLGKMAAMKPLTECSPSNSTTSTQSLKICTVDISNIYSKKHKRNPKHNVIAARKKNDAFYSSVPMYMNNSGCQTRTDNVTQIEKKEEPIGTRQRPQAEPSKEAASEQEKTVATLNQIKSILQSVLNEVKTNTTLISNKNTDPKTKDATVQNSYSQSHLMEGSHLLQSFTYSPYEMDSYLASCSRQMATNHQLYYQSTMQANPNHLQPYPLYMHPSPVVCAACRQPLPPSPPPASPPQPSQPRQVTQLPQPTQPAPPIPGDFEHDRQSARIKHTHKLIKDIYNTINTRESNQRYGATGNLSSLHPSSGLNNETTITMHGVSEIFKNPNTIETSCTQNTNTESFNTSNDFSAITQTKHVTIGNITHDRTVASSIQEPETDEKNEFVKESEEESDEEKSETASSESSAEEEYLARAPQKNKKGFLAKVMKLFHPKEPRRPGSDDNYTQSDSDNYLTICSQTDNKPLRGLKPTIKFECRPRAALVKKPEQNTSKAHRPPYMEQEIRRGWDEHLMFRGKDVNYSADAPKELSNKSRYYQGIEARNVAYDPRRPPRGSVQRGWGRPPPPPPPPPLAVGCTTTNHTVIDTKQVAAKGLSWLKKHKMNLKCGKQWKKIILEG